LSVLRSATVPQSKLRLDGVSVSKETILEKTLERLKILGGATPTQLAAIFNMSRENFSRNYLYVLVADGKVEKIEGTTKYKLKNSNVTTESLRINLIAESEFYDKCQTIKNWVSKENSKKGHVRITQFINICLGNYNPKFKINPDAWQHPETTIQCVASLKEYYDTAKNAEFDYGTRQTIRQFLDKGLLGHPLSESEGKQLFLSGQKPKPKLGMLHITWEQYYELKSILADDKKMKSILQGHLYDPILDLKFGFGAWTFTRPSIRYTVELDELKFYDREVEFIQVGDEKVTDETELKRLKTILEFCPQEIKERFPVIKRIERACALEVHEYKTEDDFPKRIFDEEFVKRLEKFVNLRKSQHKRYLFWEDNKTEFDKNNYDKIAYYQVSKDNIRFKKLFEQIGFKHGDFGSSDRVNYAIRHFGIQLWLQATNYNYAAVSKMSHTDLTTLMTYYGKMTEKFFDKLLKGVVL
jgi:hypothetical protein